ncbi:MAG: hydroxyacid dehydrogenase [Alphaproteobacteria bacterium]|nr:MAG: hydroxyacid dehydrogenase [Alphaproteobacteria bacterium]
MADVKRVFYVKYLAHTIYADILKTRSDIRLDKLENDSADDIAAPVLAGAHAYQIGSARDELAKRYHADRDLLRRTQSLLIVSTNGAGYDTVNLKACTDAGVLVLNQAGGNKEAVAEHALAMMLSLTKRIIETDRAMRRDKDLDRNLFIGHDLRYKTVGIIGLGNVGKRLAELCRGLFSMRVLAYDPYVSGEIMTQHGVEKVELDELMRQADFVSINCPLTDETRAMVGAQQYALMKPGAYFVTTARGNIHDEKALEEALRRKKLAGAGLDVWEKEPPPLDHPLLQFDNVMVSPHTAGVTREARENMGRIAAEQMLAALDGKPVARVLNAEVWPRYAARFKDTFGFAPEHG